MPTTLTNHPKLVSLAALYLVSEDAPNGRIIQAARGRFASDAVFANKGMERGWMRPGKTWRITPDCSRYRACSSKPPSGSTNNQDLSAARFRAAWLIAAKQRFSRIRNHRLTAHATTRRRYPGRKLASGVTGFIRLRTYSRSSSDGRNSSF